MKRFWARFRLSLLRASAVAQVFIAVSAARYLGLLRKFRPSVTMQRTSVDERKRWIGDRWSITRVQGRVPGLYNCQRSWTGIYQRFHFQWRRAPVASAQDRNASCAGGSRE